MFEIGSSLREARERQELGLAKAERDTRIRAKYLAALEEERFDALPAPAYAKGFLRTYAEYLGLDGQRFVDEYNERFAPVEETPAAPLARVRRRRFALDPRLLVLPLVAILAVLGWRLASSKGHRAASPPPPTTQVSRPAPRPAAGAVKRTPHTARVVLVASRGRCWVSVRLGSESGRQLYERTLEQGQTAWFVAPRLWIRLGAPWNLDATLNGKPLSLPGAIANVVVTPAGLQPAA
jgi:hypothetical protein